MRKDMHQKKCNLDLLRAREKHIPILPQISRFNPKLTRTCPQVHYILIPVLIKTSLKRLGWSPGCDTSLLATCLDREGSPTKNNHLPLRSRCISPPILPGFQKPLKTKLYPPSRRVSGTELCISVGIYMEQGTSQGSALADDGGTSPEMANLSVPV